MIQLIISPPVENSFVPLDVRILAATELTIICQTFFKWSKSLIHTRFKHTIKSHSNVFVWMKINFKRMWTANNQLMTLSSRQLFLFLSLYFYFYLFHFLLFQHFSIFIVLKLTNWRNLYYSKNHIQEGKKPRQYE